MPPGIPVATVGINGALNAAILALQIVSTNDEQLQQKLADYKEGLKNKITKANEELATVKYKFKPTNPIAMSIMNLEEIQSIINREANAILNIPVTEQYNKAVDLIVEHVHKKKGKLVISGMGKAAKSVRILPPLFVLPARRPFFCTPAKPNTAIWVFFKTTTCCF